MNTTGIILAGGRSSRMGKNKALLKINEQTVIERIITEMKEVVDDLIIVTNTMPTYSFLNVAMVEDTYKDKGPLAGIHAGLLASKTSRNVIIACDMPFLSKELSNYLLQQLTVNEAVVPNIGGRIHPLYAAYRKDTITRVEESLQADELRIRQWLQKLKVKYVGESSIPVDSLILKEAVYNMNNLDDFKEALKIEDKRNLSQ